jgi:hypothetical protein
MGKVVHQYVVIPEHTWFAGTVTDVRDGEMTGRIASEINRSFDILSVEAMHQAIKTVVTPIKQKELTREGYLAGYDVNMKVGKEIPLGQFKSRLRIHTNLEGDKIIDVEVKATRSGPILFLPPTPVGQAYWSLERYTLNLGRFDHAQGRKVFLPTLIYGDLKEKFQILGVNSDEKSIKVSLEPNPEIGGNKQQGYRLVFEVPPGCPAVTHIVPEEAHVTLKTNHPRLKELAFKLEYISN